MAADGTSRKCQAGPIRHRRVHEFVGDRGVRSKSGPDDHQHDLAVACSLSLLDEVPIVSVPVRAVDGIVTASTFAETTIFASRALSMSCPLVFAPTVTPSDTPLENA
jgi:hypothetical protein